MAFENINGALPEKVSKVNLADTVSTGIINKLSTEKERQLANAIVKSIFQKVDDYSDYAENLAIKQIDLILGRTESLLNDKLSDFSEEEISNIKDAILSSISETTIDAEITEESKNNLVDVIRQLFSESVEQLKNDLIEIFDSKKAEIVDELDKYEGESSSVTEKSESEKTESKKSESETSESKGATEVVKSEDVKTEGKTKTDTIEQNNGQDSIEIENKNDDKDDVDELNISEDTEQKDDTSLDDSDKVKTIAKEALSAFIGGKDKQEDKKETPDDNTGNYKKEGKEEVTKEEKKVSGKKDFDVKEFLSSELDKLFNRLNETIVRMYISALKQTDKPSDVKNKKQKQKQENEFIGVLKDIQDNVKKIFNFFNTLEVQIMGFLSRNIIKLAKILSKALFILFKPIILLFWATIGPVLGLIALGIFMILAAVAKNFEDFKEPIARMMEIMATAVPIIASAIPLFLEIISKIVDIVLKIITFALDELWPFIRDELWPFIKNEVWPFVVSFFEWFKNDVYEPVLKPILEWIATTLISFVERVILPVLEKILNWVMDTLIPFVEKYVLPVLGSVLEMLKAFLDAMIPWIKPLVDVIFSTLLELLQIIKPVIIELATFLADVLMDLLTGIKMAYDAIVDLIIKPIWSLFTEVIPSFGSWIWGKIKSILPWGGDEDEAENNVKKFEENREQNMTIEQYKEENERLRDKLKAYDLLNGSIEQVRERARNELEEERSATIKIDKGTIYDIALLSNNIDTFLRESMSKIISLLDSIANYLSSKSGKTSAGVISNSEQQLATINNNSSIDSNSIDNFMVSSQINNEKNTTVAVNEINSQIVSNTKENIENTIQTNNLEKSLMKITDTSVTTIYEERQVELKNQNNLLNKQVKAIGNFIDEWFTKIKEEIDKPIDVPVLQAIYAPSINGHMKNCASMENS